MKILPSIAAGLLAGAFIALGTPQVEISLSRVVGIVLLVIGAYFIVRR
jgi:uncharacterized membrane protein YdcZ (DUF606 family)